MGKTGNKLGWDVPSSDQLASYKMAFNPILPGGRLVDTHCTETFWLFLNIKKQNFGQNLKSNFLPQPTLEGGTKKMKIFKIGHRA